jgi:HSP20 family protein
MMINNLIPFEPFHELERIRNEMSRVFNDSLSRFPALESSGDTHHNIIPPVDICSTNDDLLVQVALPGVTAKEVEVSATKDSLSISGETKPPALPEGTAILRQERGYGRFKRVFRLPVPVQSDKITATFKDGVLEIKLPKDEDIKGRTVKIEIQ